MFTHPSMLGCIGTVDKRLDNLLQHILNNATKATYTIGEYYLNVSLGNDTWGIWIANGASGLGNYIRYWDNPEEINNSWNAKELSQRVPSPEMRYKFWHELVVPLKQQWEEQQEEELNGWLNKFQV